MTRPIWPSVQVQRTHHRALALVVLVERHGDESGGLRSSEPLQHHASQALLLVWHLPLGAKSWRVDVGSRLAKRSRSDAHRAT
jgi:hypothetical protein